MRSVSAFLGHANVTTTARYVNMKDDYLQECIEWKLLALRFRRGDASQRLTRRLRRVE